MSCANFCHRCGNQLEADFVSCPVCGAERRLLGVRNPALAIKPPFEWVWSAFFRNLFLVAGLICVLASVITDDGVWFGVAVVCDLVASLAHRAFLRECEVKRAVKRLAAAGQSGQPRV